MLLGGGVTFATQVGWLPLSIELFPLVIVGSFSGLAALVWMMKSILCPRCKAKLLWYAANKAHGQL